MAYTPDTVWRNRDTFLKGREEAEKWLTAKWAKEDGYRLRKELFAFTENKVSLNQEIHHRCRRWHMLGPLADFPPDCRPVLVRVARRVGTVVADVWP